MHDTVERPAREVYVAALETPPADRRRLDWLRWPTRMIGAALGVLDEPSFGDVVVRRIDDASEVLRLPVTGSEETAILLDDVRGDLEALSADEFAERWTLGD
ncbi:hypothetical protein [Aeromicrobium sp. Leaf350]|uniref:hypothetical protein n=1 Tax=Aeromicrobium sp. Leaf350 TaxID=2876565 RepID=UPI001E361595|nr:hypothetical protein [Aeromicrobium sp. Leaf350]